MQTKHNRTIEERMVRCALQTWQTIGSDVLASIDDRMTQSEVIETVMDADYMEMYGGDKEACLWFNNQDEKTQIKLMKQAFKSKFYGY